MDYVSDMLMNFEEADISKPLFVWANFIDAHEPARTFSIMLL
jgi:hypothetical protein